MFTSYGHIYSNELPYEYMVALCTTENDEGTSYQPLIRLARPLEKSLRRGFLVKILSVPAGVELTVGPKS